MLADAAPIAAALKSLLDSAAGTTCLDPGDREMLTSRVKLIEFVAYEKSFEHLLADGRAAIRGGHPEALAPLLKTAGTLMSELRKRGLDQAAYDGLKEKLVILRETAIPGSSIKAKTHRTELGPKPFDMEQRMFVRYTDPSLFVTIAGHCYRTVDWSLGGLLLAAVEHSPAPVGGMVSVQMKVESCPLRTDLAKIVRHNGESQELALQFRRFGAALMAIKKDCAALGIDPC
jgi:hypothetical protein